MRGRKSPMFGFWLPDIRDFQIQRKSKTSQSSLPDWSIISILKRYFGVAAAN